jgi:hypothetical protein
MSELPLRAHEAGIGIVRKSVKDAEGFANTDLPAMLAFFLIGLLLALYLVLRFPELGALVAQYNQF